VPKEIKGKDLKKGVDYYLTFDFYFHGNTKVRFVGFTEDKKFVKLKSETGEYFCLPLTGVVWEEPEVKKNESSQEEI
jgi:hypothetical protein